MKTNYEIEWCLYAPNMANIAAEYNICCVSKQTKNFCCEFFIYFFIIFSYIEDAVAYVTIVYNLNICVLIALVANACKFAFAPVTRP